MKVHLKILLFIVSLSIFAHAGSPFHEAPNNSIEKNDITSAASLSIKTRFQKSKGTQFNAENLRLLQEKDFIQIDSVPDYYRVQAIKLIQEGKIIAVDSVVGNATRLGNPAGGKGAVVIGNDITFLDAKIIRLAVDSKAVSVPIKQILWTSDENKETIVNLLNSMEERLNAMSSLSPRLKQVIQKYLHGNNITLMAQSTLFPVINQSGELAPERYRNLGAGELVPTIFRSGTDKLVNLKADSVLVFSNIDFDLSYVDVVAASLAANNPDLMQVHIRTKASGGSAYWVKENNTWRIIPLEGIEVPAEMLARAETLNSNTVVMQGKALNQSYYQNLPLPFEEKIYDGIKYFLPKLSLSDIGKEPSIRSAVAIGKTTEYFFSGSKNTELLAQTGAQEIISRVSRWNQRALVKYEFGLNKCSGIFK